jgi:hypothetical protein
MIIGIYRPEITVYHRGTDGEWDSTFGTQTNTLFYPMPDENGSAVLASGLRRVVEHGTEPFFKIEAPEGSDLFMRGAALYLRTPEDKALDAWSALALAKRSARGLDLVRPGRPRPVAAPLPSPALPRKPARQLGLFAEAEGGAR